MFLMVMALMPIVFASCGGDDDYDTQSDRIVGVWKESDFWDKEDKCFKDWWGIGYVHEFKPDGKYLRYNNSTRYDRGEPDRGGDIFLRWHVPRPGRRLQAKGHFHGERERLRVGADRHSRKVLIIAHSKTGEKS